MKIRNYPATIVNMMTAALFVFVLSGVAAAQGRYTSQYSRSDVDTIIRNVEDRADEFRRDFDSELNNSNLSSSQRRIYSQQVDSFENATDRLRSNFDNDNTWWRSRNQVQNVVTNSRPLNTTMNSIGFRRRIERQWNQLRNAVNRLADTYDLPGIAGGGWSGGPWNPGNPGGGGQASNPPAWARGTWYWMNGPDRRMTIDSNGRITLLNDGRTSYGTYRRDGTIYLDGITSNLTRRGSNIQTYNQATGETSDYSRNPWTGSGGGGGGNVSRPPSWAVGNWRWANGSNRTMVISANGDVTLYNNGMTSYGKYYNGTVTIDGLVSTVSRNGNRIRTYNQATGEYSDYRRQ